MSVVAAVVINYNGYQLTERLVRGLVALVDRPAMTVVVDNGSSDDEGARIRRLALPGVSAVRTAVNGGFAAGCNIGIRHALAADAEYVLILNNDTLVTDGAISALVGALIDQNVAAACPMIVDMANPNTVWSAGGVLDLKQGTARNRGEGHSRNSVREPAYVTFAPACALMLPAWTLRSVGLFDESWFLYFEDAEYSVRLSKRGHRIRYVPTAVVEHVGGAATREGDVNYFYYWRNHVLFIRRYASGLAKWTSLGKVTLEIVAVVSYNLIRRRHQRARMAAAAGIAGIRGHTGPSTPATRSGRSGG